MPIIYGNKINQLNYLFKGNYFNNRYKIFTLNLNTTSYKMRRYIINIK